MWPTFSGIAAEKSARQSIWLVLTGRRELYNQMNHLLDWNLKIKRQLLRGIECIGARDILAGANRPKCVDDFPSQKGILKLRTYRYTSVMARALRGIAHLPDVEFTGIDVAERMLVLLLDCILQVTNSSRTQDVNWKAIRIVESENPAVERDFGGGHHCIPSVEAPVTNSGLIARFNSASSHGT